MKRIKLTQVNEGDRIRLDLGDVKEFALSLIDKPLLHPIVLDEENNLIAGGRRLAAYKLLASGEIKDVDPAEFETIPYTTISDLSGAERKMLEIEENFRRKDMTWTEYVFGVCDYHMLKRHEASAEGDAWTQAMTGKLLNVTQAWVSPLLSIGQELRADADSLLWECGSLSEAIQLKAGQKVDEANREILERINRNRKSADAESGGVPLSVNEILASVESDGEVSNELEPSDGLPERFTMDQAAQIVHIGDCLELLPKVGRISHIICDPPFGIDMSNLDQYANIETVEETHKVSDNVELLKEFLRVSFDVIDEAGFLCMWYDLDHHNMLQDVAAKIGWKVCRWPFHWVKTHPCRNSAAQYNITKAVEHCMFLRRSEKSILQTKVPKNYVLASNDSATRAADHPFYKPFEVWKPIIEAVSFEGQTICDPFFGEGSSAVASLIMKRVPVGIELDQKHAIKGIQNIHKVLNAPPVESLMMEAPI